jgi:hypothetical protein
MPYKPNEIEQLAKLKNHKITYDGYEYWWHSNLNGKWGIHCINAFKDHIQAIHYIRYWLAKYRSQVVKNDNDFTRIISNAINDVRIYEVVNSDISTLDKVIEIHTLKPYANQTEISEYLRISKMAVSKHFRKLKYA